MAEKSRRIVQTLCRQFPSRTGRSGANLARSAAWIEQEFRSLGYRVTLQRYAAMPAGEVKNLIAEKVGSDRAAPSIVVGAHYDTVPGTPGADDNASGVAGTLELARLLLPYENKRTLSFVAFTHEEAPYFYTSRMGSYVYARSLKHSRIPLLAMVCLEMIGYGGPQLRQSYPFPLMRRIGGFPQNGNFVGVVGNLHSRKLVKAVYDRMKEQCRIGVERVSAPGFLPPFNLSDQSSFWRNGYRAVMVTDTAFERNPHYHLESDSPETLNYEFLSEVVGGVYSALLDLDRME